MDYNSVHVQRTLSNNLHVSNECRLENRCRNLREVIESRQERSHQFILNKLCPRRCVQTVEGLLQKCIHSDEFWQRFLPQPHECCCIQSVVELLANFHIISQQMHKNQRTTAALL